MTISHKLLLLCLCSQLVHPGIGAAETLYKSIGADGRVIYSDHPPADAKVQKTLTFSNLPASPLPEAVLRYRQQLQQSTGNRQTSPAARFSGNIQLFTAAWCGYCKKAKAYLAEKKISYQEYDIDTDAGRQAFGEAGNASGIPLLLWQGKQLQGFSRGSYDSLLGQR